MQVVIGVRVMALLGAKRLIVTNAAGALNTQPSVLQALNLVVMAVVALSISGLDATEVMNLSSNSNMAYSK